MRFDHWTKEKKQLLEYDYQQLFADQVLMMKKIYRFKSDQKLLDDILNSVSSVLYKLLFEQHFEFVEELLERMFLSILPYDVISYQQKNLEFFKFDLYFYDQHQTISYRNIVIMNQNDLIKLIEMIMYIGRRYDQLSLLQQEDVKNITAQQLVSGFDEKFIKNNIRNLHHVFYIQ